MGFLNAIYSGIKSASKEVRPPDWKYKDLETTPFLYGGEYLEELASKAKEDWQKDAVFNHMVRYDIQDKGYEEYKKVRKRYD